LKKSLGTIATWLILGTIFVMIIATLMDNPETKMTYSELMVAIEGSKVDKIALSSDGEKAYVTLKGNATEKEIKIPSLDTFMDKIHEQITGENFTLEQKPESLIITILTLLSPFGLLLIFFIFWFLFMNNSQNGNKTMSFGKSKARLMGVTEKSKTVFADVAGVDEEKEELEEIVEFLKSPKKFTDMGARIPKGVLLVGAPRNRENSFSKSGCRRSCGSFLHNQWI